MSLSTRLPRINDDRGNWGEILNGWLKSIGGYAGTGYGNINNQFEAANAGLNFSATDPTPSTLGLNSIPTGFTYINTTSNQIRRWNGNSWQILLQANSSDTFVTGGTTQNGSNFTNQIRLTRNDNQTITFDYLPAFQGNAGRFLRINSAGDNLEWAVAVTPQTDIYVNGATFSNNILTLTRNNASPITVNLSALQGASDADWFVAGGITVPTQITQNIYTRGRVGIGDFYQNANPGADLEISATNTAPFSIYVRSSAGFDGPVIRTYRSRNNNGSNGQIQTNDFIGSWRAYGHNGTGFSAVAGSIEIQAAENFTTNANGTLMRFSTVAAGNNALVERIRIHSNGRVGINQINPVYRLDVNGTTRGFRGGFISDHAYRFNGQGVYEEPADVNNVDNTYDHGGFISMRHFGKRNAGEIYDWTWQNMRASANSARAAGLHLIGYTSYTQLFGPTSAATNFAVFTDTGRFGLNTPNPAHTLTVVIPNTNITGSYQSTGWQHSSDGRLKDKISNLENALSKVLQLRGVSFVWKNHEELGKQIGFIAQEVKGIVPELVTGIEGDIEKGETLAMNYANLTPLLVEAIKEQQKIIEALQAKVSELESKIN